MMDQPCGHGIIEIEPFQLKKEQQVFHLGRSLLHSLLEVLELGS